MMRIWQSCLTDPFANLALEHWLFKTLTQPSLFLYVNAPAVVIGRAQNPWMEANLSFLQAEHIPLVRRQSGGGAVVHDTGNLNFSFISPKARYDKNLHLDLVLKALQRLNLHAERNERHDLLVQNKKISGSAFRETRENCFHHGTLLIDANLPLLRQALAVLPHRIQTHAVPSVRSPVMNLAELQPGLTVETVKTALIEQFCEHYDLSGVSTMNLNIAALQNPQAEEALQLYQSSEWIYGRTLPFQEERELDGLPLTLVVENAMIVDIQPRRPEWVHLLNQAYDTAITQTQLSV